MYNCTVNFWFLLSLFGELFSSAKWEAGEWGTCTAKVQGTNCGEGRQSRSVTCSGNTCDATTEPPDYQDCYLGACGKMQKQKFFKRTNFSIT